jgi:hypothetical protein
MSQTLTLHYTPNQQDYASVVRYFNLQRTGTKISLVLLGLAFIIAIFVVASKGPSVTIFELIWLFLPPVFVIYAYFIQPTSLAKKAAQNEKLVTEATWEVSDAGVQITSKYNSTLLEWENINKLVTTKDYYLLLSKTNKNAFRFIPRRAFISVEEEEQFRELVERNIARTA